MPRRWRHAAAVLGDFLVVIGGRETRDCAAVRSVAAFSWRLGDGSVPALEAELEYGLHSVSCAKVSGGVSKTQAHKLLLCLMF